MADNLRLKKISGVWIHKDCKKLFLIAHLRGGIIRACLPPFFFRTTVKSKLEML